MLGSGLCEDIGQSGAAPTRLFFALTILTKNQEIAAKLGMKRKLKPDAVPTIDLSLADTTDTIDQSLTDRAKRQVRLVYVLVF